MVTWAVPAPGINGDGFHVNNGKAMFSFTVSPDDSEITANDYNAQSVLTLGDPGMCLITPSS